MDDRGIKINCQEIFAQSRHHSDRAGYAKSLALLRETVNEVSGADRMRVTLEIASVVGDQGYRRDALDTLQRGIEMLPEHLSHDETLLSIQMKMDICLLKPLVTASFKTALEEAEVLRIQASDFAALKDLEPAMIETALSYSKLRFLSCEYHDPVLPSELEDVVAWLLPTFEALLRSNRFREARRIMYAFLLFLASAPKLGVNNLNFDTWNHMIHQLISSPDAPPIIKAGIMGQLACRSGDNLTEEDITKLEDDAIRIFNDEGHRVGAMDVRCQQISRLIKKDHTRLTDDIFEELKGYFSKYEASDTLAAYQTAISSIVAQIPHWLGFDVQLALSHIDDELSKLSGALLISQASRFRMTALWLTRSGAAPRAVEAAEAVYAALEDGDCRFFKGMAAYCAAQAHSQLQDFSQAQIWAEKAADEWRKRFPSLNADATNALLQAKLGRGKVDQTDLESIISFAESEMEKDMNNGLTTQAQQKVEMIIGQLTNLSPEIRGHWIQKAELWMSQFSKPGLEESDVREATFHQLQAAHLCASLQSAKSEDWEPSMVGFDKAVALYMKHRRLLEAANTRLMQSRAVFRHFQLAASPERLQRCLDLVEISLDLFKEVDNVAFITLASQFRSSTIYTGWTCGWVKSDVVLAALKDAEEAWARERDDMTVFAGLEAVSRRQQFTSAKALRDVYQYAFLVCLKERRLDELWEWTQRGKARSLSDQLGVDGIIPAELREHVLQRPDTRELTQKEEDISNQIKSSTNIERLRLRGELDAIRKQMWKDPLLKTILDIKNGTPVRLEQIRELVSIMKAESSHRDVVFVDWVEYSGRIWLVVLKGLDEQPSVIQCQLSVDDVTSWKQQWLDAEPGDISALEEGDLYPENDPEFSLRALDDLVAALEELSKPGDLLVFCPTGILHSIPLHALWVPSQVLILERNPIVYSVSLTTFWQCCSRVGASTDGSSVPSSDLIETQQSLTTNTRKWTLAGVFEKGPGRSFDVREQDAVYSLISDTATILNSAAATGITVTRQFVSSEMEQSALFHFFGHCLLDRKDLATQALELSDGMLTVRDMFDMKLHAPHITLVACDSASQGIAAGDEPLGIVTALLCAGAGSVLGTIWPTASGTGRRFTTEFYKQMPNCIAMDKEEVNMIDLAEKTQSAVLALRRDIDTNQPYHWAAFVLHGSWAMKRS